MPETSTAAIAATYFDSLGKLFDAIDIDAIERVVVASPRGT